MTPQDTPPISRELPLGRSGESWSAPQLAEVDGDTKAWVTVIPELLMILRVPVVGELEPPPQP